jgi:methanogenic corrinoid protein MtbC1
MGERTANVNQLIDTSRRWNVRDGCLEDEHGGTVADLGGRRHEQSCSTRVRRTVEAEVVPRLVLSRRPPPPSEAAAENTAVDEFTRLVLRHDEGRAVDFVAAMRAEGVVVERIYLDLLAPTARHLGELWSADVCSFVEVTLALGRLQHILRTLSRDFQGSAERVDFGRNMLLLPLPGEQHTFGMLMVAEFFRRAAWSVWCQPLVFREEITALLRSDWFALVGFSLSCENRLDELAAIIRLVRRVSRNRLIGIMVGGPVFAAHPEYAAAIGADSTALDGRQASLRANEWATEPGRRG